MATAGRKNSSSFRPIGENNTNYKYETQGTDAQGRYVVVSRNETPTKIDEVSTELYYLGYADFGAATDEGVWKIKRISKSGTVWRTQFVRGDENYIYKWDDRSLYVYE